MGTSYIFLSSLSALAGGVAGYLSNWYWVHRRKAVWDARKKALETLQERVEEVLRLAQKSPSDELRALVTKGDEERNRRLLAGEEQLNGRLNTILKDVTSGLRVFEERLAELRRTYQERLACEKHQADFQRRLEATESRLQNFLQDRVRELTDQSSSLRTEIRQRFSDDAQLLSRNTLSRAEITAIVDQHIERLARKNLEPPIDE